MRPILPRSTRQSLARLGPLGPSFRFPPTTLPDLEFIGAAGPTPWRSLRCAEPLGPGGARLRTTYVSFGAPRLADARNGTEQPRFIPYLATAYVAHHRLHRRRCQARAAPRPLAHGGTADPRGPVLAGGGHSGRTAGPRVRHRRHRAEGLVGELARRGIRRPLAASVAGKSRPPETGVVRRVITPGARSSEAAAGAGLLLFLPGVVFVDGAPNAGIRVRDLPPPLSGRRVFSSVLAKIGVIHLLRHADGVFRARAHRGVPRACFATTSSTLVRLGARGLVRHLRGLGTSYGFSRRGVRLVCRAGVPSGSAFGCESRGGDPVRGGFAGVRGDARVGRNGSRAPAVAPSDPAPVSPGASCVAGHAVYAAVPRRRFMARDPL
jgi:hypothetical protein